MPTLKQLTCTIEWAGSQVALKEYSTAYSDGFVQTYVAIPPASTTFSVHLKSNGYIAPGLAMFVYMDGKYQCNRNRRNLRVPDGTMSRRLTEIDFRVRQKEEKLEDGSYLGKEWRFEKLNTVSGDAQALKDLTMHSFEHLGTIEIVVLRCHADPIVEAPKRPMPTPSADSKPMAPSDQSVKSKNPAKAPQPSEPAKPQAKEADSSSHLYQDMMGGIFDGPVDEREPLAMSMPFGGDGGWDQPSSRQPSGKPWDYTMTNENQGVYHPPHQPPASAPASHGPHRSRSHGRAAHHHYKGDWREEQDNGEHGQRGSSRQRVSSFHSAGGNAGPTATAWPSSPASSVRNTNDNKGWGVPQVSIPPGGPAVIINVNQPVPSVAGWGGQPDNPPRPSSPAGSLVTRKSVQDYGAQRQGPSQGRDHTAGENYATQPIQFTSAPSDQGVELVDGKWRPKKPKEFGWSIGGGEENSQFNHQRKISHATVITTQQMPGAWGLSDNHTSNPPWKANNTSDQAQNANWGGGGNDTLNNNNGRCYGSDSSNNGKVGGWGAENKNQNATTGWNNGSTPGHWNEGNNNCQNPGKWNQGSNHNGPWNNQQVPTAGLGAYPNTLAQNSPVPGTPINNNTVMPGAWGQPANNIIQEPSPQPPPPPPQPSPPVFTQTQNAAPAPAQQGPPAAHSRVHSIALSTQLQVKPYWAAWNKPPSPPPAKEPNTSRRRSEVSAKAYVVNEEPLYSVPEEIAAKKRTSHQVQPGPGAMYAHKVHSPRYMDSMEEPYAVFVFKYRSKEVLVQLLNLTISDDPEDEKKRLMSLSKDEIIEELLAAKAAPSSTTAAAAPPAPAPDQNQSWGAAPASAPPPPSNAGATNQWQNNASKPAEPAPNQWQNPTNNATRPVAPTKQDPFADALTQKLSKVAVSDAWGGVQQNAVGPEWGGQGGAGNWAAQNGGGGGGSNRGGFSQQGNGGNWGGGGSIRGGVSQQGNGGNWGGQDRVASGGGVGGSQQGGGRNMGPQQDNGGHWGGHTGAGGRPPSNEGNGGRGGAQGNGGNWGTGLRGGGGQAGSGNWGVGGGGGGGGADAPPGVVW